ncbi:unnamed protein product [Staurois parvus]|uniref:Uncharacterized protein n=1 Tax=Staurois parvus TaxID=386267 RepID=A0ABN9C329_9NEOB|nr:unnamed protein product [Staurois parvus]
MGTDWHKRWALTGCTDWQHCIDGYWWVAQVGTGGWAQVGTGRWHFWAQVGALVGGTSGWHCWAPIIRYFR